MTANNRLRIAVLLRIAALVFPLLPFVASPARAQTDATWLGGNGNYNDATKWNTYPAVPNNIGENFYNVFIDHGGTGTNSAVNLNMNATIDSLTIDNGDSLRINSERTLTIVRDGGRPASGTITNNGTLEINSLGLATTLRIDGATTLDGIGVIKTSTSSANRITGVASTDVLTLNAGQTIRGSGQVGVNLMGLINNGTIEANPGADLVLDPSSAGVVNNNVLQARDGGTLRLQGGTFTNTGAEIKALTGSVVELGTGPTTGGAATVVDGTLTSEGTGVFRIVSGDAATLKGAITNNSTLEINSLGLATTLRIDGATTVDGIGVIKMSTSSANRITGVASTDVLTLNAGQTIRGSGQVGVNLMGLINNGTIEANPGAALSVDLSGAGTHNGTFKATGGGTLIIKDNLSGLGQWVADGGKIQIGSVNVTTSGSISVANGGELELNGTTMTGSNLAMGSTGIIDVNSSLSLSGNLSFAMTNAALWDWGASAVLEMTGGSGAPIGDWASWSSLEIGGADLGIDPDNHVGHSAGFSSNFDLTTLTIGIGAHVFLADLIDNGHRNPLGDYGPNEALYVDTLRFLDGTGLLNLNGLHIYYKNVVGDINQIIDQPANTAVPEPSALVMMLGFAAIGLLRCGSRTTSGWLRRRR